ncbi:hypothetical protein [Nocardiopsis ansamitocini]|uniref:DUF308 domain-containing protein n=1 Tax=Nocardiopsis ansamitocini TaxID=1670832 RepID=A0A9W6UHK4_9ACTN|nr:hypothetical protein [Nocardiopsis ansamitocini]GLU46070.1 hypothetical protein Nans01_04210 [Nocardiopsis ansamitocini]
MTDRRGNGLLADTYVPLILLPPTLADTMLSALGRAGIAAYATPLDNDVLEPSEAPGDEPPTDHLYVDANERRAAEEVLRTELPDLEERQDPAGPAVVDVAPDEDKRQPSPDASAATGDDAVWEDLVSRFYESAAPERAWPDAENVSTDPPSAPDSEDTGGNDDVGTTSLLSDPQRLGSTERRRPTGPDDGDHFVPPPPPPFPRGDLTSRLAWAGLIGGPAALLVATLIGMSIQGWQVLAILAAFVAGFVVLLIRMGDQPPSDSGPDDGAVI